MCPLIRVSIKLSIHSLIYPSILYTCMHPFKVSDGGVHSHITHLEALLEAAKQAQVPQAFVHFFSDGRDTAPISGGQKRQNVHILIDISYSNLC